MKVIELNWFNRYPMVGGGTIELSDWGSPDTSMLLTENEAEAYFGFKIR